uniref:Uncharacterized protein n=1 Tax=Leersia perrieri TaxID=77586 RepID=A0A0D9Y0L9_9ORYZ
MAGDLPMVEEKPTDRRGRPREPYHGPTHHLGKDRDLRMESANMKRRRAAGETNRRHTLGRRIGVL